MTATHTTTRPHHTHSTAGHPQETHPQDSHPQDGHGHSHGLIDHSIVRSRAGVKAVSVSLAVLGLAAFALIIAANLACAAAFLVLMFPSG
jgi:hypothetical protein